MMLPGLSEQIIAAGLPWREVWRIARRLAGQIPSRGVIDEDDLASVGLAAASNSSHPLAAAMGAMVDEIRRQFGRTGPGRRPRPIPEQEEASNADQISFVDKVPFDDWQDMLSHERESDLGREARLSLGEALSSLSESQRDLVRGLYVERKTQRQLASERGVQAPAISKQHKKALAKLRALMDGTGCSSTSPKKLRLGGAAPPRKPWETLRSLCPTIGVEG